MCAFLTVFLVIVSTVVNASVVTRGGTIASQCSPPILTQPQCPLPVLFNGLPESWDNPERAANGNVNDGARTQSMASEEISQWLIVRGFGFLATDFEGRRIIGATASIRIAGDEGGEWTVALVVPVNQGAAVTTPQATALFPYQPVPVATSVITIGPSLWPHSINVVTNGDLRSIDLTSANFGVAISARNPRGRGKRVSVFEVSMSISLEDPTTTTATPVPGAPLAPTTSAIIPGATTASSARGGDGGPPVAAIVVPILLVCLLLAALVIFVVLRRRQRNNPEFVPDNPLMMRQSTSLELLRQGSSEELLRTQ